MLDLILRGGTIADGTGQPCRDGDVGILNGRVVEVGSISQSARREVDVRGLVVAPGFVDIHTHYDAQINWDPTLSPSGLHGITTAIGGNCGYTVAPMTEGDASYLTRLLARVEGMPLAALEAGVSLDWRSFGEWLDRLEGRSALNVGFLVGHSTIRRLVMGDAATQTEATEDQIALMRALLAESIAAGGLGFSSSWSSAHFDADDRPVPSRSANLNELISLAGVVKKFPGTVLEFVPGPGEFGRREAEAMTAMSLAADRPINWNVIHVDKPDATESAESRLATSNDAELEGAAIVGLIDPDPVQLRVSIASKLSFVRLPGWADFVNGPPSEQLMTLRNLETRRALKESAATGELLWPLSHLREWQHLTVSETLSPKNKQYEGRTVGDISTEQRKEPFDVVAELAIEDDLRTFFLLPERGNDHPTWEARAKIMRDRRAIVGGSDAGAHLAHLCGARYTTSLLSAVRKYGVLSLEETVHYLSDVPARFYGLGGRGRIAPGYWADIVVFDFDRVGPGSLRTCSDLPAGASRLHSDPEGIMRVFVNGTEIVTNGVHTGSLPGCLLRSTAESAETVDLRSYRAS